MDHNKVESKSCNAKNLLKNSILKGEDTIMESEEYVRDTSALLSLHPWIFKKEPYQEGIRNGVDIKRGSLRSGRGKNVFMKPVSFVENYMDDFVVNSPPNSPSQSFRSFVVTDGDRIVNKSGFESFSMQHNDEGSDAIDLSIEKASVGISSLLKRKSSDLQHENMEASEKSCKVSFSEGSQNSILHFSMGFGIGMISALILKRTEVETLNKLLKQSEDLVQDLQEEFEMKDSMSVKEIACGTYENQIHNIIPRSCDGEKTGEVSDSLSKIEAELEEELERLEKNMNACSLEQRMSDLSELDPDLIVDVVQGELKADNLDREILETGANSNMDTKTDSTTRTYNANYSVPHKDLSLRLHEVIQARLEARIEELEKELLQTQLKLSNNVNAGLFSSNREKNNELHAYDDAYEDFMQIARDNDLRFSPVDKSNSSGMSLPWENSLWSRDEEDDGESSGFSDEEGKMLIRQLVEKTKQGSPALVNAQKMLFLMDE